LEDREMQPEGTTDKHKPGKPPGHERTAAASDFAQTPSKKK